MEETKTDRFMNFIERHKIAITAVTVAAVTTVVVSKLSKLANNGTMEFIEAQGLMDAYKNHFEEN